MKGQKGDDIMTFEQQMNEATLHELAKIAGHLLQRHKTTWEIYGKLFPDDDDHAMSD